jgi:alkylation response protein AidB-like acyl-CoA dehydrogenase
LSAEEIWCQAEPGAGSDLAAARTRMERKGDVFVVNGQKVWSSFAHIADWCILIGLSDPDAPRYKGLTYMMVDMHAPGVEVRPLRQITGEAEFNEIFFTDVEVPAENLLGEEGQGWQVAMTTLLHERGTLGFALTAALEVGVGRLVDLARERVNGDRRARRRAGGGSNCRRSGTTTARSERGTHRHPPEGSAIVGAIRVLVSACELGRELLGPEGILDAAGGTTAQAAAAA